MARKKNSGRVTQIVATAAGLAAGEAAARGIAKTQLMDQFPIAKAAVPGGVGLLMMLSKDDRLADFGAGMLGAGVVNGMQMGIDTVTKTYSTANGFSRVSVPGSVQKIANGIFGNNPKDEPPAGMFGKIRSGTKIPSPSRKKTPPSGKSLLPTPQHRKIKGRRQFMKRSASCDATGFYNP